MTQKISNIFAMAVAVSLGGTAAMAMDNEREVVGSMVQLDDEMMSLFEVLDADGNGSVTAEEVEMHQAMMNKFVMMALDNKTR